LIYKVAETGRRTTAAPSFPRPANAIARSPVRARLGRDL